MPECPETDHELPPEAGAQEMTPEDVERLFELWEERDNQQFSPADQPRWH